MLCNGCIKLSFLVFYLQLATHEPIFRRLVWFAIAITLACTVAITFTMFFLCVPAPEALDLKGDGSCKSVTWLHMITAVFNIVTTVIIIALPLPTILKFRLSKGKTVATIVFSVGAAWVILSAPGSLL